MDDTEDIRQRTVDFWRLSLTGSTEDTSMDHLVMRATESYMKDLAARGKKERRRRKS